MTKTFDELCKELNVTRLFRAFDDSMGRAKENKLLLDTAFTNNESNKALLDNIPSTDKIKTCTCGAINNQISIEENGDLMPCDLLEDKIFSLGNLLNINNLKQFMLNHICNTSAYMIFRALLPNQFEKCKNCKVNYFCLSCMHEVYKMKNDPNYFTRYCNGRKQYLYKLIWDET
jgi:radical SAM protein with 4Fe4S-binding SPASM domain